MAVPISNVTRRQVYAPSGSGGAGPYAFTFEILANTDIAVYKEDTLLTLTTHYTVTINSNGTGSVTITAAGLALSPTSPTQYAIVGNRTISRSTDFTTGGDFFANTINDELDQQTIFAQQNAEGLQRALTAPQTDPTTIDMTLPKAADRANKTLAFDANGDPTLGISAADVANAVTYATNAANSATAAASSASSASSSASSASSSASTASTQASNASTSATNASNSASSASTSATNAASSASTASTQASNASTSATNAASSSSSASTSASNASTSATNASNSASAASTSASNAATSETNAAASAASAASALDSFDDRYLGSKTSNPTLDNDGNALVTGALYYRSTAPIGMKVYDGAQWIEASAAQQTALVTYEYVATAGQTTFSGADANSLTLSYIAGGLIVSLNGAILRPGDDYTASNGTSIVLVTAASLNDELCAYAFSSFQVANTYTQAQVDAFAVKLTGNQTVAGTKTFSSEISAPNTFGFKNRIINGAMVIDQRNAGASQTVTTAGAYTVDRFFVQPTGANVTTQRVAGSGQYQYALRITGAASVTQCFIQQKIEALNSYDLAGQTVTVTIRASSSTLTSLTCYVERATAGVDNWSTFSTDKTQAITITSTPTDYTFQATLSGSATNGIRFIFSTGAFTSGTLDITGVQLEKGSTATSFDYRPYGTELALCQRYYYQQTYDTTNQPACTSAYWSTSTTVEWLMQYPVNMRATPSISVPTVGSLYALEAQVAWRQFSTFSVNEVGNQNAKFIGSVGTNTTFTKGQGAVVGLRATGSVNYSAEL